MAARPPILTNDMSQTKDRRKENKLEALSEAEKFCDYTIKICDNEKIFLPKHRNSVTAEIISLAKDIYVNMWTANDIRVLSHEDCVTRLRLQIAAKRCCRRLLPLIQLCKSVFHLPTRRVVYWGKWLRHVKHLLDQWHERDRSRYSGYL